MFQAGFFVGPFVGGFVVPRWGYGTLFGLCAALSLAGTLLTLAMGRLGPSPGGLEGR
jgi:predicted MFS family arabinose efflux permease